MARPRASPPPKTRFAVAVMQGPARRPVQAGPRRGDHQNRQEGQDEHDVTAQQIAVSDAEVERWHQTATTRGLLENDHLPGDLENQIGTCVDDDQRDRERLNHLSPADRPAPGLPAADLSSLRGQVRSSRGRVIVCRCFGWQDAPQTTATRRARGPRSRQPGSGTMAYLPISRFRETHRSRPCSAMRPGVSAGATRHRSQIGPSGCPV